MRASFLFKVSNGPLVFRKTALLRPLLPSTSSRGELINGLWKPDNLTIPIKHITVRIVKARTKLPEYDGNTIMG